VATNDSDVTYGSENDVPLSADEWNVLHLVLAHGKDFDQAVDWGIPDTPANRKRFDDLKKFLDDAPEGVTIGVGYDG
jgi:hypothetical protein